ncbi:hypothetical protein BJ546DRAFT_202466 [Cryomyces antarcticus]
MRKCVRHACASAQTQRQTIRCLRHTHTRQQTAAVSYLYLAVLLLSQGLHSKAAQQRDAGFISSRSPLITLLHAPCAQHLLLNHSLLTHSLKPPHDWPLHAIQTSPRETFLDRNRRSGTRAGFCSLRPNAQSQREHGPAVANRVTSACFLQRLCLFRGSY